MLRFGTGTRLIREGQDDVCTRLLPGILVEAKHTPLDATQFTPCVGGSTNRLCRGCFHRPRTRLRRLADSLSDLKSGTAAKLWAQIKLRLAQAHPGRVTATQSNLFKTLKKDFQGSLREKWFEIMLVLLSSSEDFGRLLEG